MNIKQIILLVISTIMMILAIWNLVLYVQIEYLGMTKENRKKRKELEEKAKYYGRLK